jgi:2-keto-3-deoxy-L-rhamnonate aldolase RhmA
VVSRLPERLAAGEILVATWIKTPSPHVVEVLAISSLDALVLDAEHAPFDRAAIDLCILAARAGGKPVLVRPASADPAQILNALDCGADGVIVPHIRSVAEAEAAVAACHYRPGGRGYAGSTRAAGYTTKGMARHRADAAHVCVIAQIEDAEALDEIEAIAAVKGLDALFVGRADLTVSLDAASGDDPVVVAAVERICAAGVSAGRPIGMFLARPGDAQGWKAKGATLFILASDHEFLLSGAAALAAEVKPRP